MPTKRARTENNTSAAMQGAPIPCTGLAADIPVESLILADLRHLQAAAAGSIDALQTMNPFLEAERQRWKRLSELANPCKGVLEGLRMQSIRFDSTTPIATESLRRMAEDCAPHFSSLDIGLGSDAIAVLGTPCNLSAVGGLHGAMRAHAVPRLPSPKPPRVGRCRETLPEGPPLGSVPKAPSRTTPASWPDDNLDDESGWAALEQLVFQLACWKPKKTGLNKTEKHQLNLKVDRWLLTPMATRPSQISPPKSLQRSSWPRRCT
jgi:hypothetical protein